MRDFSLKLVPLLEDNIRVMIYAGTCLHLMGHLQEIITQVAGDTSQLGLLQLQPYGLAAQLFAVTAEGPVVCAYVCGMGSICGCQTPIVCPLL